MSNASILALLPRPVDPVPGDSFDDRVLLLFAAVARTNDRANGELIYPRYERAQEGIRHFFGDRVLDAVMQAKFHYALLHPPLDPIGLARKMAGQAAESGIIPEDLIALCCSLRIVAKDTDAAEEVESVLRHISTVLCVEELREANASAHFQKKRDLTGQIPEYSRKASRFGLLGMGGKQIESLCRKATGWLSGGQEKPPSSIRSRATDIDKKDASESLLAGWDAYRGGLPGPHLMAMLDAHATQLTQAAFASLEQARCVVNAAVKDLDAWDEATELALLRFHETLSLRLMESVSRKVIEQERRFAGSSVWKHFAEESRAIASQSIDTFLDEQRIALRLWEEKLQQFSVQMDAFSRDCLERLSASISELNPGTISAQGDVWSTSDTTSHVLVQLRHHMKTAAIFASGLALGRFTALGPVSLAVSAGGVVAFALVNPFAAAAVATAAGAAGYLYHLGREDKRKAAFLEKKRREANAYADHICETLRVELKSIREELGNAYSTEIKRSFAPALESLLHQSAHLHLFVEVMRQIKSE